MSGAAGLISEPMGSVASAQPNSAVFPSSAFEGQEWFAPEQQLARLGQRFTAETGSLPLIDPTLPGGQGEPEPMVDPSTLNRAYAVGDLRFSSPLPDSVAMAMSDAKRDEIMRQDAASRTPPGIAAGVARLGAGFIAGVLDPVNLAAAFVPGLGEAGVARTLGLTGMDTFLARSAVRGIVGASAGVAGQIPLSALRYGLSQQDGQDYGALDALSDIAMGGVLGGGLHTAIGGVSDVIGRTFQRSPAAELVADNPEARQAALNTAVAAVAEDRPVDVSFGLDAAAATEAEAHLSALAEHQRGLDGDQAHAQGAVSTPLGIDHFDAVDAAVERLAGLQRNADQLNTELSASKEKLARDTLAASDPISADRVAAIDAELGQVIPRARRTDLMAERTMVLDGRDVGRDASAVGDLQVGRTQAEIEGSQAALSRIEAQREQAQSDLDGLHAKEQAAMASQSVADRTQRIALMRVEGRQAVAQSVAERTLRRVAGQGDIPAADIASLARSVLTGEVTPPDAVAAIGRWRRPGGEVTPIGDDAPGDVAAQLRREAGGAATDAQASDAGRRAAGAASPEDVTASQAADRSAVRMADVNEITPGRQAELDDFVARAREAGALSAADEAELSAADDLVTTATDTGNAFAEAAACMIRSGT